MLVFGLSVSDAYKIRTFLCGLWHALLCALCALLDVDLRARAQLEDRRRRGAGAHQRTASKTEDSLTLEAESPKPATSKINYKLKREKGKEADEASEL